MTYDSYARGWVFVFEEDDHIFKMIDDPAQDAAMRNVNLYDDRRIYAWYKRKLEMERKPKKDFRMFAMGKYCRPKLIFKDFHLEIERLDTAMYFDHTAHEQKLLRLERFYYKKWMRANNFYKTQTELFVQHHLFLEKFIAEEHPTFSPYFEYKKREPLSIIRYGEYCPLRNDLEIVRVVRNRIEEDRVIPYIQAKIDEFNRRKLIFDRCNWPRILNIRHMEHEYIVMMQKIECFLSRIPKTKRDYEELMADVGKEADPIHYGPDSEVGIALSFFGLPVWQKEEEKPDESTSGAQS